MYDVREIYERRLKEIDEYLNFILPFNEGKVEIKVHDVTLKKLDFRLNPILKANVFVMLYNLIESTVNNCLEAVHDKICDNNIKYSELNESLQKIWYRYYFRDLKDGKIHKLSQHAVNSLIKNTSMKLSFSEYNKIYRVFSGNLDVRAIREVLKKYGIKLNKAKDRRSMLKIKEMRNKLAHGEISYVECGRSLTISDLEQMFQDVKILLNLVIDSVESYILNEAYKCSVSQ